MTSLQEYQGHKIFIGNHNGISHIPLTISEGKDEDRIIMQILRDMDFCFFLKDKELTFIDLITPDQDGNAKVLYKVHVRLDVDKIRNHRINFKNDAIKINFFITYFEKKKCYYLANPLIKIKKNFLDSLLK